MTAVSILINARPMGLLLIVGHLKSIQSAYA